MKPKPKMVLQRCHRCGISHRDGGIDDDEVAEKGQWTVWYCSLECKQINTRIWGDFRTALLNSKQGTPLSEVMKLFEKMVKQ